MKKVVVALGAALIATVGVGSSAQAATIDFGVAAIAGKLGYTGATLQASTAFKFDSAILLVSSTGAGDASGLTAGVSTITLSPTTITYGSGSGTGLDEPLATDIAKSWTDSLGSFTETLTTVDAINRASANAITVTLDGTITGPGFSAVPAVFIFTANQSGGPKAAISATFTNTASTVPEPSTWAMMVLGFIALGYTAFRRNSRGRAVAI